MMPHLEWLYRRAYRYTGQREDAEDLVQELLERLYRYPHDLATKEALKPWLMRALHNLFIDQWRHRRRTPQGHLHPEPWEDLFAGQATEAGPEDKAQAAALQRGILAALYELDPEQRALLVLHDVEGYNLPELADSLHIPLGTLKSRLFRARRALRMRLENGNLLAETDVMLVEV